MKKTSLFIVFALLALLVFSSCGETGSEQSSEFYIASEITGDVKEAAERVLSRFMQDFEEENAADALSLFSSDFSFSESDLSAFFKELSNLTDKPFVPYDAYYMNNLKVSDALIKVKKNESDYNYIELTPANDEIYCAMYVSEGEKVSYMMTILLTREGEDFKIAWVNPTDFKYREADAPALYEKTKKLAESKKTIPAYVSSCMLSGILRPGGYFRYGNDVEMEDLCYNLYAEISDSFALPLALESTNGSSLYEIGITKDEEYGIIPLVLFKTEVPISDKAALQKEAQSVLSAMEKLSPGLSEIAEYARFEATNDEISEDVSAAVKSEKITLRISKK